MFLEKINRDELLKPLTVVSGIIDRKQPLPILSNVLIEKKDHGLIFLTTDMEMQIEAFLKHIHKSENQSVTVSAKKLQDILRVLGDGTTLSIDSKDNKLILKAEKSRFSLQTLPAQDFPRMPDISSNPKTIQIQQQVLKKLLNQVQYAMAQQDIRYYLNGILVVLKEEQIKLVATDGHRLAYTHADFKGSGNIHELILSRKTVNELSRLLSESDEMVQIEIIDKLVRFNFNDIVITSKIIDGKFPDYERVIPEYSNYFDVNRLEILQALQRTAVLSNEKFKGVRFILTEKNLRVVSSNSEQEEAQEEIENDYHGPALDIGFNVNYLLDGIQNLTSDHIRLSFGDSNSSILITIPNEQNFKYVVMPMRI